MEDLEEGQENGCIFGCCGPCKNKNCEGCRSFIQPKPGTDAYLAMALAKVIISHDLVDWDFVENKTKYFQSYMEILESWDLESLSNSCDVPWNRLKN